MDLLDDHQRLQIETFGAFNIGLEVRRITESQQGPGNILVLLQLAKQTFGFA